MHHNIVPVVNGENENKRLKHEIVECRKVEGTVVLMKKNILELTDPKAYVTDGFDELLGHTVTVQLLSAVHIDPENEFQGRLGQPASLEWKTLTTPLTASEVSYKITFDWDNKIGVPGAFLIRNNHHSEFYLKTVTLEDVPGEGRVYFVCNSWVYPTKYYKKDRIFFSNKAYLPNQTPLPLRKYREQELESLRGEGNGQLEEADRVYDYAYYNDLGEPDKGPKHIRPILGGSIEYPYPRRIRTGRPSSESDPKVESRLPLPMSINIYVPRDEQFHHLKKSDFIVDTLKSIAQLIGPELPSLFGKEFHCFEDVLALYKEGIKLSQSSLLDDIKNRIPLKIKEKPFKFPIPQVIQEDKSAWMTDEEFAREMIAGVNPVTICRVEEFPPRSRLDHRLYGDQKSSITKEHLEISLDGLSLDKAIEENKLFILDHHDTLMPYLRRINETSTKVYASRTILFLKDDGTLKPAAIELSLPHPEGDQFGSISKVYTPSEHGIEGSFWKMAKAYVAVNDSGFHQLISHWLSTHAVIEPFIIATNRQLSVLHPVYKLLQPHFRDTLYINALARQILINAGGVLELTVFPGRYSMEMSSKAYRHWKFTEQALPENLKNRGMAVEDKDSTHGLRLLIEDYPFAVDGLEIWSAIKEWVKDYCSFYYQSDKTIQNDRELQSWWKEVREEGHGDKRDEPWWPKMQTCDELIEACTIIIWLASAFHAAVNFGQYPYGGYLPNRPSITHRLMPERGSAEYEELESNFEKAFFKTVTARPQALLGISLVEILSRHSSDEVYLGQRDTPEWTSDAEPLKAFEKFSKSLAEIEDRIMERNKDERLKNRVGPVNMPYTLLIPSSEVGLTGKGIPNSVSI
ncbi:hypothetical protein K2173_015273 [Erythroxylum novogranatense]|uniref:Lipoxygenase n=1 Tax=Erythroxylum novogranatense TaxID=1862640 RepID=A0AAV8T2J8_9ROSI|nr:hypothetical protein K2173_015273 [Erythroxylum novogranatense]